MSVKDFSETERLKHIVEVSFEEWRIYLTILTHVIPLVSFYTTGKHEKTYWKGTVSGDIERDQWNEMG